MIGIIVEENVYNYGRPLIKYLFIMVNLIGRLKLKVGFNSAHKAFSNKKCNSCICILNTPTFYVLRTNFRGRIFHLGGFEGDRP